MSREYAYRTNCEISHLCIDCKVKFDPDIVTETTQHLIECSDQGKKLIDEMKPFTEEMTEYAYKRLSTSTYCKTRQECKYFLDRKIYTDEIDLLLGIGKIQQLKDLNKQLHKKIVEILHPKQQEIIQILRAKNRLSLSYH